MSCFNDLRRRDENELDKKSKSMNRLIDTNSQTERKIDRQTDRQVYR